MKIGELVQSINGGESLQRISRNLQLHPINLAKVLKALGYSYVDHQFIWKHKRKEPLNGDIEDYIISVLGMTIGELIERLNRGESLEKISSDLDLKSQTIVKILKMVGFASEQNQWVWQGKGKPPFNHNILDFVIYQKTIWQRLKRWSIPFIFVVLLFFGFSASLQGDVVGDFYTYKAEALVLKSFGSDHLIIKHNGKYFIIFDQGEDLSKVKGDFLKVLVCRNRYGLVWYKLDVKENER